ncbi:HAD family hydrolase [Anaerobacillus sp. MEB173]|uniref:HAD family hydrolase n=1 Tax=Anaerobacillus sp. MEB173 TaxID=3383345 RepID=UPI003F8F5013
MRWNCVFFDLDNTLFSHEEAFEKAIHYCFHKFRNKWNREVAADDWFPVFKKYSDMYWDLFEKKELSALEYRRLRYQATLKDFAIISSAEEADEFHRLYYDVVDDFSEPYPGLVDLLTALTNVQIPIGIITNGTVDTQYNKIEKLGIQSFFSPNCIFISEEFQVAKPSREIFDLALKTICNNDNIKPLFVGDSWEHDIIGAINAGWDAIYLNTRNKEPNSQHRPVAKCRSLKEVAEVLYKENRLKG